MAVRIFQFSVVFTIGFCIGPAAGLAVATGVTEISQSLHLKDPHDVTVGRGQPATLRCEASSTVPVLNISWLYEDNPIAFNDSRKQTLNDGSLYIKKVAGKKMEGRYQCLAKNSIGSLLSNSATLKIASIHEFMEQPQNISAFEFQPILLPCQIQSTPSAIIQWERDNTLLPHNTRYVPLPTGALLITSTGSEDTGSYRCIATNKLLKKIKRSKVGTLTVVSSHKTNEPLKSLPLGIESNQTIVVHNNLSLYCAATGWPKPTIQWSKDSRIVAVNTSILQVQNVTQDDGGNYTCLAYNSNDLVNLNYYVEVAEPPYFNITPTSISFPPARTVRLDCQAHGIPPPKLVWLKNGKLLETVGRIKIQPSGLVLSHSFTTDQGLYQCVAINSVGRSWVSSQLVPYFSQNRPNPPQNVQCEQYNDNSVCLTWDAPTNATIQAYSIYAFSSDNRFDFVTNYTYYLAAGLDKSTNYTVYLRSYSKEASDQSNNVSCSTGVSGVRNLIVRLLNETSVNITWSKISNDVPCGSSDYLYKVQWRRIDQSSFVGGELVNGFNRVVSGLRPLTTYEFNVQSKFNKNDNTPWTKFSLTQFKSSSEPTITTSKNLEVPSYSVQYFTTPQQVEAQPLSSNSVNLTWLGSRNQTAVYTICYIEVKDENQCENGIFLSSTTNYLVVENLSANTMYEFKVRSQVFNGTISSFSHSVQVQTFIGIPSSIRDLHYTVINSSTICLKWRTPLHKNGKIIKYIVFYTTDPKQPIEKWNFFDVSLQDPIVKNCRPSTEDSSAVILPKLKSSQTYGVSVRAATKAGIGKPITPILFSTKESYLNSLSPDFEESDVNPSYQDNDPNYNQKLGVILGVSISLLCIACCVSCIFFRKQCLKRRTVIRARDPTANNHFTSISTPYESSSLYMRHPEVCNAEAHEMQYLVEENLDRLEPLTAVPHLDTKGPADFPNDQPNGPMKLLQLNGHAASNGIVHITENPRYNHFDCNGHIGPKEKNNGPLQYLTICRTPKPVQMDEELVLNSKDDKPIIKANHFSYPNITLCENNKSSTPKIIQASDYNSNCNNLHADDPNVTQLTDLDDSFPTILQTSPILGPNG